MTEPRRDGGGVADGEGKLLQRLPSHPLSRELSQRESLWVRNLRGMGFARSPRCKQRRNTKAKLAINDNKRGVIMDGKIKKYIEENKVCSDLIFRNWSEFVELLFECGGFVNEILWFEYVLIDKQKDSLGGGGYGDKENPEYMWAETMIYDRNMKHCSLEEIRAHIVETIDKYKPHHLVPCFFDIG